MGFADAQITEQFCSRMKAERDLDLSAATLYRWYARLAGRGTGGAY